MDQTAILAAIAPTLAQYDVPLQLVSAIIQVESGWNVQALGDNGTSFGIFQLHIGGQFPQAYLNNPQALYDPALNAQYAMPAIANAWDALKGSFNASSMPWWLSFAASSGHPGGSSSDPATINEAKALMVAYQFLQEVKVSIKLNSKGMVADFAQTSQFWPNETEFGCGPFSVALCKYAGQGASGTSAQVHAFGKAEYTKYDGADTASDENGTSIPGLHSMIADAELHCSDVAAISGNSSQASDIAHIKAALNAGYPVIATITEVSVRDLTGDIPAGSPYEWSPSGTHIFVYVGIASDGNLLVCDPANVVGPLQGSNSVRAWPRKYDASKIANQFATIVQLPWLASIPSGDPTSWTPGFNAQEMTMIPTGWKDNGSVLTAPNGVNVVQGFRAHIINAASWDAGNTPQEAEYHAAQVLLHNASIGGGQRQVFRDNMLWYTGKNGVVQEPYLGLEIDSAYTLIGKQNSQIAAQQAQITALQAQLAQQPAPTIDLTKLTADAQTAVTALQTVQADIAALGK